MEKNHFTLLDETLFENRIIQLSGPINADNAKKINKALLAMDAINPKSPIYLYINSPGGEVSSGFSIFDTARYVSPKVITIVCGLAASAGSLIALCAKKEDRYALPNSKFLIHQPLISGMIRGSASELEIHANDIVKVKRKINEIYSTECNQPMEVVEKATDRDNWMTPEEAKEFGLIKKIIGHHSEIDK